MKDISYFTGCVCARVCVQSIEAYQCKVWRIPTPYLLFDVSYVNSTIFANVMRLITKKYFARKTAFFIELEI